MIFCFLFWFGWEGEGERGYRWISPRKEEEEGGLGVGMGKSVLYGSKDPRVGVVGQLELGGV